jgi:hypothetical protein
MLAAKPGNVEKGTLQCQSTREGTSRKDLYTVVRHAVEKGCPQEPPVAGVTIVTVFSI